MFIILLTLYLLTNVVNNSDDLQLFSTMHTDYLQKFSGYSSLVVVHFHVPDDTEFVSFVFKADQSRFSIFNCDLDEVVLYMKHGSLPVLSPDDSKFPKDFYNASISQLMHLEFMSDKSVHYINLTSPRAGYYYATAFHPYVDPQDEGITQAGLTPQCSTFIDASLYIRKYFILDLERTDDVVITVPIYTKENQTYKFYIPEEHDRLILTIKNLKFCVSCEKFTVQILDNSGRPGNFATIVLHNSTYDDETIYYRVGVRDASWYYMQFFFEAKNSSIDEYGHLEFDIKTFSATNKHVIYDKYQYENRMNADNLSDLFSSATFKTIRNDHLISYVSYKEYSLVRNGKSDSFFFSFDLHPSSDGTVPLSINLTNTDFTVLKFFLNEAIDIGGTLEYIVGFTPRIARVNSTVIREAEPENHIVIVCIRNNMLEVPTWPNHCTYESNSSQSPIVLNKTVTNSTVMLPYPEAGWWYITLKLYCGECIPCNCPDVCIKTYNECVKVCEIACNSTDCGNCSTACEEEMLTKPSCEDGCNCDGPCLRTNATCNTSVLFDLSSFPCISGNCGKNGRCVFMISQGLLYSTCICSNNYKGLDCSDDSDATPFPMVALELSLLVISNIIFVPAAYIAYRRKYYIEAIVYFSTFLSSTFYHACDAGENIISFCIVRLYVLQFSDFFSGLLSIWVTLIAMAYLPYPWNSICHISGCIILAFGTTYDKQSLWVFAMPAVAGVIILLGHWFYIRKKTGKPFPTRRYVTRNLPIGVIVAGVGLLLFGLFQTQSNYKYIHSLWHILMGIGVMILLPDLKIFLPAALAESTNSNHLLTNT